ncbi:hypothetical protein HDU76_001274 [Blyttiomyces sp. JEL0837]|nr:hypothetical protein HDU76_001274 [Blyttiomyces sp. JEL0837]
MAPVRDPIVSNCLFCIPLRPGAITCAAIFTLNDLYNVASNIVAEAKNNGSLALHVTLAISIIFTCFDIAGIIGAANKNPKIVKTVAIYNWVKLALNVMAVVAIGVTTGLSITLAVAVVLILIYMYLTIVYWSFWMDLRDSPENYTMTITTPNV